MKFKTLLEKIFDIETKYNTITTIYIYDEKNKCNGLMSLVRNGGAFKVYLQNDPSGDSDFAIIFDKDNKDNILKQSECKNFIYMEDLEEKRIKLHFIQDLLSTQRLSEINEYLESGES